MKTQHSIFHVNLFYSYCHKDARHRNSMENALAVLRRDGVLKEWSDRNILPGQHVSKEIEKKLNQADILVFLISSDFINSDECMKEWTWAKQRETEKSTIFRVPIIVRDCAWKDLLENDDLRALPNDGKPVANFTTKDAAWQEIYEGIKSIINQLRNAFTVKQEFLEAMEKTEFVSQQHIKLQELFVFLPMTCYAPNGKEGQFLGATINNPEQLLDRKYALIHGEEMSGKTALGRYLFLYLTKTEDTPVLHMDLKDMHKRPKEDIFRDAYHRQFNGDYDLWKRKSNRILILDNLDSGSNLIDFVVFSKEFFGKIYITLHSDIFHSFFRDERRLADFHAIKIEPLTHRQQEDLIRKRLKLSDRGEHVTDGLVDQIENQVNSIVISNRIVPRYPFFVLTILQTYEAYMPENLSITSFGHCYNALILANLIKSGISRSDSAINACFHFAENFAFTIYQHKQREGTTKLDFDNFVQEYKEKFLVQDSMLNRLRDENYGIITKGNDFRTTYMYYFFLGRFLARSNDENKLIIEKMCEESYISANNLTLLFIIHHASDNAIIDDILLSTMYTLDDVAPASLNHDETKMFESVITAIPQNILSSDSVEVERGKERDNRDLDDPIVETEKDHEEPANTDPVNSIYRILKNNRIMGQIMRNKYGSLEKGEIETIIETIADSGLRLIKCVLANEEEMADLARYIHKKCPEHDLQKIKGILHSLSFLWTMINVECIVSAIKIPDVSEAVDNVVRQKSTPAYDLIGYFYRLDNARELTNTEKEKLDRLLKKHKYTFFKGVLSLRTQHYMNTHRSKAPIEQGICSLLNISYSSRIRYLE